MKPAAQRTAGLLRHGQKQWRQIGMLLLQDPKLRWLDKPVADLVMERGEVIASGHGADLARAGARQRVAICASAVAGGRALDSTHDACFA